MTLIGVDIWNFLLHPYTSNAFLCSNLGIKTRNLGLLET